jgi:hypothetical protein
MRNTLTCSLIAMMATACAVDVGDDTDVDEAGDEELIDDSELVVDDSIDEEDLGEVHDAVPDSTPGLLFATGNLIANPGFEQGETAPGSVKDPLSWGIGAGLAKDQPITDRTSYVYRSTSARSAGDWGLRITSPAPLAGWAVAVMSVEAVPGRSYTITARTRRRSGDQQHMLVGLYDDSGLQDSGIKTVIKRSTGYSTSWHTISQTFTAPAGTKYILIQLGDSGASTYSSTHDWDSIKLVAL